jgi:hypothetical protein
MGDWHRNAPSENPGGGANGPATPLFPRRHAALGNRPRQEDNCARKTPRRDADADQAREEEQRDAPLQTQGHLQPQHDAEDPEVARQ